MANQVLSDFAFGGVAGASLPINTTLPINGGVNPPDQVTDEGGGVWLRTGVIDSDVDSYPEAAQELDMLGPSGTEMDLSAHITSLTSATSDGLFLYALDGATNTVHKFFPNGTLLSSLPLALPAGSFEGITYDGTDLVTIDTEYEFKFWDINTGALKSTAAMGSTTRVFTDLCTLDTGDFVAVSNESGTNLLTKYRSHGGMAEQQIIDTRPTCIEFDGTYFWICERYTNQIVQAVGGDGVSLAETGIKCTGWDGGFAPTALVHMGSSDIMWVGNADGLFKELQYGVVGEATAYTDPTTGYPLYLKVK